MMRRVKQQRLTMKSMSSFSRIPAGGSRAEHCGGALQFSGCAGHGSRQCGGVYLSSDYSGAHAGHGLPADCGAFPAGAIPAGAQAGRHDERAFPGLSGLCSGRSSGSPGGLPGRGITKPRHLQIQMTGFMNDRYLSWTPSSRWNQKRKVVQRRA